MISYVTIGADDIARAKRFYDAILKPMGHLPIYETNSWLGYGQADGADRPKIWICNPINGKPATVANGSMVSIHCPTPEDVDRWHANGLAAGGVDEGGPGRRAHYNPRYYIAYLRDPQGNKLSGFCLTP
jgi:catechol 2,3-dioxygenase-like lactoylglutathione lyase family enzyme